MIILYFRFITQVVFAIAIIAPTATDILVVLLVVNKSTF